MIKTRAYCITLLFYFLFSGVTSAQSWIFLRNEVFGGIGASNFLGELGGANGIGTNGIKDLELSLTRPSIMVGYRFKMTEYFSVRTTFVQGWVSGDDAKTNDIYRQNRNLNFKSPISELTCMLEIYPLGEKIDHVYQLKGVRGRSSRYFNPYLAGGIGGFYFNPKGKLNGTWYKLHPLKTEGQGLTDGPQPYKRLQICIPMAVGFKYTLNKMWSIGFEISARKTFTDYIDDVSTVYYDRDLLSAMNPLSQQLADPSLGTIPTATLPNADGTGAQRGDPTDNDAYMFAIISVHYRFLKYRMHLPKL